MSNKESVDKDIREYLAKADNLRNEDKMNYLRALFDKHFTFTKLDHNVTRYDFLNIIGDAKGVHSKQRVRPQLSGKEVDQWDQANLSVIEAFIGYLNRNGLLKKHVCFDYTDDSNQYEAQE